MYSNDTENFYGTEALMRISRQGYHKAKTDFFINNLSKISQNSDHAIKILDIACNDGELTSIYAKYGKATGIDLNPRAVKEAKKKGLNCIHGDVLDMASSFNGNFDVVIAGDIIEHIFDTDVFLQKVHKLLHREGKILLTTPNVASFGRRVLLLFGRNPYLEFSTVLPSEQFNVGHIRYYTSRDLVNQLQLYNFKNIRVIGDRVNLAPKVYIPHILARHIPFLSRNLMVYAEK